jgi:uncharacterized protein
MDPIAHRGLESLRQALNRAPVVAIVGPRQVGKTTLARQFAASKQLPNNRFFDLERTQDRIALNQADDLLAQLGPGLMVFDEVQFAPQLFQSLRVAVDLRRAAGHRVGQFLVLGSASLELLQGASESLAGRIEVMELKPFAITDVGESNANRLWLRGGFPDSFLAASDTDSFVWREQFVQTYLARDIPQFAPRLPRETLGRFWRMLAHLHGTELNASNIARTLEVSSQSISRYLDLLCDLFLARRLNAFATNAGKRLRKSPKVYLRDCGVLHALLGIEHVTDLMSHPVVGTSFEGFVIEHLLDQLPSSSQASFYRTQDGAEIDLVIEIKQHRIAVEIKRSVSSKPSRGFHIAAADIAATHHWLVHSGDKDFPLGDQVQALSLPEAVRRLNAMR